MQVYQILNTITGKSYIGKSKNYVNRFKKHKNNSLTKTNRLYSSMRHHGVENFQLILLEDLGEVDHTTANNREIFWIAKFQANNPEYGYNMTKGGDGGYTLSDWSEDDRKVLYAQQGKARTGHIVSEETRQKLRIAHTGMKKFSDEQKKKISEYNKANGISPPIETRFQKGGPGFTGTHSKETRKRLSEYRNGKTYEELFGIEKARQVRQQKSISFKGNQNHQYIHITDKILDEIKNIITTKKIKMYELCTNVGLSKFKFRQVLVGFGVNNYQDLYQSLSESEWIIFWREKYATKNQGR